MLDLGFNLNRNVTALPRKFTFDRYKTKITRNGLATNPVQNFNFTGGTPFSPSSATNLVTNGDFSNGNGGYFNVSSNSIISNNKNRIIGTNGQFSEHYLRVNSIGSIPIANHKYYFAVIAENFINSRFRLAVYSRTSGGSYENVVVDTTTTGLKSAILSVTSVYATPDLQLQLQILNSNGLSSYTSDGTDEVTVSQVRVVDLTATFGAGNEPTKAWCDANIPFFNGTQDVLSPTALVRHGNSFFVGGDTATYEFDFSTKVAGSVAECPMKIYRSYEATLQAPTWAGFTGGEETIQSNLDYLKTQDGAPYNKGTIANNFLTQILVELDLTSLCNSMFGGSNSALKSALKAINVDCYAMGSGSNGGVLANGVSIKFWENNSSVWSDYANSGNMGNGSNSIAKMTATINTNSGSNPRIGTTNKFYILIASQYASDGTIASSVSLDYINIKVDLARTPDVVQPIPVNLPKYWAMLVKGWSPNYVSNAVTATDKTVLSLINANGDTSILAYQPSTTRFAFNKCVGGSWASGTSSTTFSFSKNTVVDLLFGQCSTGQFLYVLLNNGTVQKVTNTDTRLIYGNFSLYISEYYTTVAINQADAFVDNFTLIDLQRMGKFLGFSDAEADSLLRGNDRQDVTITSDFTGKVSGSVVENPNKFGRQVGSVLVTPSGLVENSQSSYDSIMTQNSNCYGYPAFTNTQIPQHLFSFDLISIVERKYGTIPATDKVAWLKANIKTITANWYGYGNCPVSAVQAGWNGLYAVLKTWDGTSSWINAYEIVGINAPSKATANGIINSIDVNGFVHFLAHTMASDGATASTIYTDYISLDVTVKAKPMPITIPNPELFDINAVQLHANATRSNGVVTLNGTIAWQGNYLEIPVLPNNQYQISVGNNSGFISVYEIYNNFVINADSVTFNNATGVKTFITKSSTNKIKVLLTNSTTGTFTFSNISLKRKD